MRSLGVTLGLAQRATASGARIFQVLDREPRIVEPPGARRCRPATATCEFRGVDAQLHGARRRARTRPSCATSTSTSPPGAPSRSSAPRERARRASCRSSRGCMTRAADAVLIDGADVRQVRPALAARAIAVVSDDPFLFSTTVRQNIAYARPDASDAEGEQAAERAQADELHRPPAQGYDTLVGERGLSLSGGQRQRLAIARALLADPRDAHPRRRHLLGRRVDRARDQGRAAEAMRGRTTFVDRAPAVHDRARRRDRRDGAPAGSSPRATMRAAVGVRSVPRDRGEGSARPGVPHPQAARAEVSGL